MPGVLALAAIGGIVLGILLFARVGALHGDTYRLYVAAGGARGVIPGTEVWLAGQKVGLVSAIRFRDVATDTSERMLLELDVLERYREQIREDSYAQVRAGGTLIGAQVVYVGVGSPDAPVLAEGDTMRAEPQGDTESVASQMTDAARQLPLIVADLKMLGVQLGSASGTLGALGADGPEQLEVLRDRAARLTSRASEGRGTIGLAMRDATVTDRVDRVMARVDSLRALLASDSASHGRFRRDSTLLRAVAEVRDEASIVRALVTESRGTAGRILNDGAVTRELSRVEKELGALMKDIQRDPLRYVHF
jgi:phospholipid/cholesterol/gamma-HCH transport system substrate-binding protein